jgi:hypothetical protein
MITATKMTTISNESRRSILELSSLSMEKGVRFG